MKIRARRGVCIGVDKHLAAGEEANLDGALITFLVGIGAVEVVKDEPGHESVAAPDVKTSAEGSGESLASGESKQETMGPDMKSIPAKAGKKKE